MQPRRPDSSKSRVTQKTIDTQLNQSKFSQTFTSYTTFQIQKKDEFERYMQQKQKDPKFKKYYQQSNLAQIQQKQQKPQSTKINSKPFQKRTQKTVDAPKPTVQQTYKQTNNKGTPLQSSSSKWTLNQISTNGIKKQNKQELNSSKSFAQKNKQKMNSISSALKKTQNQDKKTQRKIDLKGFKVVVPGKKSIKTNQEQKQAQNQFFLTGQQKQQTPLSGNRQTSQKQVQKAQRRQEQVKRQEQLLQISRFINQVQMRNMEYYPQGYEQFVENNQRHTNGDLQKININDFLSQATQRDYEKMQRKIRQNQQVLGDAENKAQSRTPVSQSHHPDGMSQSQRFSIDLDKMLDGESSMDQEQMMLEQSNNQIFLSSISSKDLREKNLFLTQVLKGRVTKQDINKLQLMQKAQIKMIKLEDKSQKQDQDDGVETLEINMMKKKSNRLFQRNMVEATGQIYRDCDYLSEENRLRLERLLDGQMDTSPFQVTQWERFAIRRLDQGIRLYRQFSSSYNNDLNAWVIPEECLPKDPDLRKQAQRKILKQKINSINRQLQQIQHIVVNQSKIQTLIQEHRTSKILQSTQCLIDQRKQQFSQISQKSKLAVEMLTKAQKQKQGMQKLVEQMQGQYKRYEKQCLEYQKMSVQQIRQVQKAKNNVKRKVLQKIEKSMEQLQRVTDQSMNSFHRQMQDQIEILRQIQTLNVTHRVVLETFHDNQTIQDLDDMFNRKASQDPQLVRLKQKPIKQTVEQTQQNQIHL